VSDITTMTVTNDRFMACLMRVTVTLVLGAVVCLAVAGTGWGATPSDGGAHAHRRQTARMTWTSAWQRPVLTDPTTVTLSNRMRNLVLNQHKDYVLKCPSGPMRLDWALVVWGGHNVVLQNCDIDVTVPNWAGAFKDQTGTLWIDDVHFGGRHLTGGIQLQEPAATVVMRDVLFDKMYGSFTTNHAECIQTWAGPSRLLIDGMTCTTTYQGLFLLPNQWDPTTHETVWDLRNINIAATGAFALWLGNVQPSNRGTIPSWHLDDVYVSGPGEPRAWDGTSDSDAAWRDVSQGSPPRGAFVRATAHGATGIDQNTTPTPLAGEQAR